MKAKTGNRVKVKFVGRLEEGTVFGESYPEKPLEFTLGREQIISGFEEAVLGMEEGEEKEVKVPPEKGFGTYDEDKKIMLDRSRFPEQESLEVGRQVSVVNEQGSQMVARIDTISKENVTLDCNHPLAGRDLHFKILLMEIA